MVSPFPTLDTHLRAFRVVSCPQSPRHSRDKVRWLEADECRSPGWEERAESAQGCLTSCLLLTRRGLGEVVALNTSSAERGGGREHPAKDPTQSWGGGARPPLAPSSKPGPARVPPRAAELNLRLELTGGTTRASGSLAQIATPLFVCMSVP